MADSTVLKEPIKTKRLILREARQYDLGAMHLLYSNREVMKYWYVSISVSQPQLTSKIFFV